MDKRAIIRLELDLDTQRTLHATSKRRGMTQIAMLSRMVQWLVKQDELIQVKILSGLSPDAMKELAKRLREAAARKGK